MNSMIKSIASFLALLLFSHIVVAFEGDRLGLDVFPRHYDVDLSIDPEDDAYRGEMRIHIDVKRSTKQIRLHAKGLRVEEVSLETPHGARRILSFRQIDTTGVSEVSDENDIEPGSYRLKFKYDADYSRSLNGLYKIVHNGRPYVFTHFQPVAARSVFPLFDEPIFKATWSLQFHVPQGLRVLANGVLADASDTADGNTLWRFSETAPLLSYALAFAVGEFDEVIGGVVPASELRSSPLPVRGYAAKGEAARLGYALSTTVELVPRMEAFLGVAFPYKKLDIVAVPEFMPAGMENAGLLFYRSALVQLGSDATEVQRKDFRILHAHELAHQWFGNDVSIRWWNDLWLNEGFATWLSHYVTDGPGLKSSTVRIALHRQMRNDALSSALPLRLPVPDTAAIDTAFNRTSYDKAAFLIDVLYRRYGEQGLRSAISGLISASATGHYDAEQWLTSLRERMSPEAAQWFESYSAQPGIPLLIAEETCSGPSPGIVVRQTRYVLDTMNGASEFWPSEVCVLSGQQRECKRFDEAKRGPLHFKACTSNSRSVDLSLNDYAVWALDETQWQRLLEKGQGPDRATYLVHLAASLRKGTLSADQFIELLPKIASGSNVALVIDELKLILDHVSDQADRKRIIAMFGRDFTHVIDALTTSINSHSAVQLSNEEQRLLYFLALDLRHPRLRDALLAKANRWVGAGGKEPMSSTSSGSIGAALSVGVQVLGEPFWDTLFTELGRTSDGFSRAMLIQGLAAADTDVLAARVHALIPGSEVTLAEKPILIFNHLALAGNSQRMFEWLKRSWPSLQAVLPPQYLVQAVTMTEGLCEKNSAGDVRTFFSPLVGKLPGGGYVLDTVSAKIALCATFKSRHGERLRPDN